MTAATVVPVSAYDAVCRRVHTELLLRIVLDAADAKGRPANGPGRQARRKIEDPWRYGAIPGRHCSVYGFSLHGRNTVGLRPGNAGPPALRKHCSDGGTHRRFWGAHAVPEAPGSNAGRTRSREIGHLHITGRAAAVVGHSVNGALVSGVHERALYR